MAPRHREIEHALDDGFVVAWDSSEVDHALRDQLIEAAREQITAVLGEHPAADMVPERRKAAA